MNLNPFDEIGFRALLQAPLNLLNISRRIMLFLKIVIFIFVCVANHAVNSVTVVSDDTLISIIQENKDLVILFGN